MFSYEIVSCSSRGYYSLGEGNMCCNRCMDRKALLGKGDEIADAEINQYSLNITRALGEKTRSN